MNKEIVPIERIAGSIYLLRGRRVMLDFDRAGLYGVATKVLNQALKCDTIRFPDDFMFQLSRNEVERISQIVTASSGAQRSRSQFAELEKRVGKHDERIDAILEAIRQLMAPPEKPRREIGFHVRETAPRSRTRKS
jgi:ORF6N domain